MGYETTLIFCESYNHKSGYWNVISTLDMCKITYDKSINNLIDLARSRNGSDKEIEEKKELVKDFESEHKRIFTSDGDYTEELRELSKVEQDKDTKEYSKIQSKLSKKIPYIYYSKNNREDYTDMYGDLLLVVSLEEIKKAIDEARSRDVLKGEGVWYRYDIALSLIESIEKNNKDCKVIMWGH